MAAAIPLPVVHCGYQKGIQGRNNSCYLDSTLMALFYSSNLLDNIFLKDKGTMSQHKEATRLSLNSILMQLRNNSFCSAEETFKLRVILGSLNPKLLGEMMDVEEFIATFCGQSLGLTHFINYTSGTSNYFHQLILNTNSVPSDKIGRLQILLQQSLKFQSLEIQSISVPMFLIKMPRSNGRLVGFEAIIPPMKLNIPFANNYVGPVLELQAVICLRYCHYTCFIRSKNEWVYFDSMAPGGQPEVTYLENFENLLIRIQNQCQLPTNGINQCQSQKMLNQLIKDIHFCVYFSSQSNKQFGFRRLVLVSSRNPNPSISLPAQSRPPRPPYIPPVLQNRPQMVPIRQSSITYASHPPLTQYRPPLTQRYPNGSITPQRTSETVSHWSPEMGQQLNSASSTTTTGNNSIPDILSILGKALDGLTLTPKFISKILKKVGLAMKTVFHYDLNSSMSIIGNQRRLPPEESSRIERLGLNKGIECSGNTSGLAAIIFSLFSNTRINDYLIVKNLNSPDPYKRQLSLLLKYIVDSLRFSPYLCRSHPIQELHSLLMSKLRNANGNMQNANIDQLVYVLFEKSLQVNPFITYTTGCNFVHNLIVPGSNSGRNSKNCFNTTQNLFINSMKIQNLKLYEVPRPQLILKLQYENIGVGSVVPSLKLNLQSVTKDMLPVDMDLFAIICRKANGQFVCYVKYNADQNCDQSCWVKMSRKSETSQPVVIAWPNLYHHLNTGASEEEMNRKCNSFSDDDSKFIKFCKQIHICVYKYWEFSR